MKHARVNFRRHGSGFTLPEVLATLVFMGIVLPAIMKGVSLAVAAADEARHKVEAAALAENKLAEVIASATTQVQAITPSGDFGVDWPAYRWEASSITRDVDLSEIQVRVIWNARGTDRAVILSTLVYTGTPASTSETGVSQ